MLSAELILPRRIDQAGTSNSLRERWSAYLKSARAHEEGHLAIAREARSAVLTALRGVAPASRCSELREHLESTAQEVLEEFRSRDREYDETTNHGATQGARFP
jgi:predicted secreted Zn-dependent protease